MSIAVYRGAINDNNFFIQYQDKIKSLYNGNYVKPDLEKLKNSEKVYSYRLNQKERLIFTFIYVNGRKSLLLLMHLTTHNYDRCAFLKSGILKRYLLTNQEQSHQDELIFEENKEPLGLDGRDFQEGAKPIIIDFFSRNFIQLSIDQEHAVKASLPVLVSGVAGSGKTITALGMMANIIMYRKDLGDDEPFVVTYICKSPLLAQLVKDEWEMLPIAIPHYIQVQFTTIKDLVLKHTAIKEEDLVTFDYFSIWYQDNKRKLS